MATVEWNDSLSVGDPAMDLHHRHLIGMLGRLHGALDADDAKATVCSVLMDLLAYVDFHFSEEETRMEAAGFPGKDEHLVSHRRLTAQVISLKGAYDSSPDRVQAVELHRFLSDWLINHIQNEDMAYKPWLQKMNLASLSS